MLSGLLHARYRPQRLAWPSQRYGAGTDKGSCYRPTAAAHAAIVGVRPAQCAPQLHNAIGQSIDWPIAQAPLLQRLEAVANADASRISM